MSTTVFLVLAGFLAFSDIAVARYGRDGGATYPEKLNYIDLDLLQNVCDSNKGNVLISPASVKTLLGLLLEGADNTTAQQLRFALRLDNEEQARTQLYKFQLSLQNDGLTSTTLQVANRLFLSDKVTPKPKYQQVLYDKYNADTFKVNMARTGETAEAINKWVNQTTNGLIPTLVEPGSLDPNALLVLTNAIFFRGLWETSFEARNTVSYYFKVDSSRRQRALMMENVGYFRYASKDFGQILEMEYKDKRYSMVIVLPRDEGGIDALARDIPHIGLFSILKTLNKTEVWVSLPRFSIEFNTDLVDTLKKPTLTTLHKVRGEEEVVTSLPLTFASVASVIAEWKAPIVLSTAHKKELSAEQTEEVGITDVFGPKSDLSKMVITDVPPVVSKVFHKAKIQVNEEGATAAGVSGAIVVPLMGNPLPRFVATHPFLFFIRDVQTNGFLFAGRLSIPDEERPFQPYPEAAAAAAPVPPSASSSSPPSSSSSQPSSFAPTTTDTTDTPGGIPLKETTAKRGGAPMKQSTHAPARRPTHAEKVIDE